MARISLLLPDAHSLKDKRMVIRRIKDRVRDRLRVFLAEVGSPEIKDAWRHGELGVAVASSDRQKALALIDDVVRLAMSAGGAEIGAIARYVIAFDGAPARVAVIDDRRGAVDKAVGGDDWAPAAWGGEP